MLKSPCVVIVGAGPGDPGLITVRGQRHLEAADVVVYDHQVHARLLRSARHDAEKIDVGPAAPRPLDQDAISLLLVEKARENKTVVRLKWGDPFVFDSGGKEALFLHEQGVPFEVIPGIPAAIGVPAYAGIPITYPGGGDVVTLVRGHEAGTDTAPKVDWARLAGLDGTLLCHASAGQIGSIANGLLSNGRSPDECVALVYGGTMPSQKTVVGTLGDIVGRALDGQPAVMVIGPVANLREHLRWFDDRPLFGRRIVVTRSASRRASSWRCSRIGAPTRSSRRPSGSRPPTTSRRSTRRRRPPAPTTGLFSRAPTASTRSWAGCSRFRTCASSRGCGSARSARRRRTASHAMAFGPT